MKKPAFSFQLSAFRRCTQALFRSLKVGFTPYHFPQESGKGFTLLLAALVASIVLSLATAIFSIAEKEVTLSSVGRNSQVAFYAADSASECALFWDVRSDLHVNTFATSTASSPAASVSCDGQTAPLTVVAASSAATSSFSYVPNGYCAEVYVEKSVNTLTGAISTTVHADGYSTKAANAAACASAIQSDPQALQRSVELHY